MFFGGFAVLWGAQIMSANVGNVLESARVHRVALLAAYALLPVAAMFLVHFAMRRTAGPWPWIATAVVAGVAIVATATLVTAPDLVIERIEGDPAPTLTVLGPAAFPLFLAPFLAAFYVALVTTYLEYRRAPAGTLRQRARGLLLALALFTSYLSVRQLWVALDPAATTRLADPLTAIGLPALLGAGTLALAAIAIHMVVRPPPPEGVDAGLLLAFILPAATAAAEIALAPVGIPLTTLGFWRFAAVAAIVYSLANYQLFDLNLRLKRHAGPVAAGLLLAFGVPVALSLASGGGLAVLIPAIVVEAVGVGATLVFHERVREVLFPGVEATDDYVYRRKLEVYRASLDDAHARGLPLDAPDLRELRLRLGIRDRDARLLEMMIAPARTGGPTPDEPARVGAEVLGRYRLERLLGAGSHGRTFLATDRQTRQPVVVKVVGTDVLGGSAARTLLREARLGASLSHPHVVQILDVAEGPHAVLLVMEHAEGGNLQQLIDRHGTPPAAQCLQILEDILDALEAVHAKGLVHRNLKPVNVLLDRRGRVKISDFGAARTRDGASGTEEAASAGLSLLHMSPEQVRGVAVDARSDLYQAATLFYQILTDRHPLPIAGKDDFEIRRLVVEGEPRLEVADPRLKRFLTKALAKEPADRFPSAAQMREALRATV